MNPTRIRSRARQVLAALATIVALAVLPACGAGDDIARGTGRAADDGVPPAAPRGNGGLKVDDVALEVLKSVPDLQEAACADAATDKVQLVTVLPYVQRMYPKLNAKQQESVAAALTKRINAARQGNIQERAEICPAS
jgi:hypothetical protein